jgi:hypothetical protein
VPFLMWQFATVTHADLWSSRIFSNLSPFTIDPMNRCIRYSIARNFLQPVKRNYSFPSIRSFTNTSTRMDPVSTGLNSVTTTNGEGKPTLRYADVRKTSHHEFLLILTQRQADRNQPL